MAPRKDARTRSTPHVHANWKQSRNSQAVSVIQTSALLALPAELRLMIYDYAIEDEASMELLKTKQSRIPPLPIAQTCQLVRNETLPLYFERTNFVFKLNSWLYQRTSVLRRIQLLQKTPDLVSSLKRVTIQGESADFRLISLTLDLSTLTITDARVWYWARQPNGHHHLDAKHFGVFSEMLERHKAKRYKSRGEMRASDTLRALIKVADQDLFPHLLAYSPIPGPGDYREKDPLCMCTDLVPV